MKKSYTISIPVGTFWRTIVPLALFISALGMLLGIFLIDRLVMPTLVHANKGMIEVPAIVNLSYEDARQRLYDVGLYCDVQSREFNDNLPKDVVSTQDPVGGAQVKKGRQIEVVVSKGPLIGTIPTIHKLSERQARAELRKGGFEVADVRLTWSEEIDKDQVVRSEPEEGTMISREMPVKIYMSNGPKPTHAEVPNVVGESISSARTKIEDAGLVVGAMTNENSFTLTPGTVISQSVSPGSSVTLESAIDLVVAVRQVGITRCTTDFRHRE